MTYDPRFRAGGTLREMRHGAVLHREIYNGGERWWLSTGINIRTAVAHAVIADPSVHAGDDGLFADTSQTYRIPNLEGVSSNDD
jgi:hypothetical protein